ncbi:MAG: nucleoside deaminase [Crocinitomicaceae bacterium]|nr:nucleoside deaminase [Crocinitomicaceae bacterium]
MIEIYTDEFFMKEALKEANQAFEKDEVPVGAVVVLKDQIIGRGHNLTEQFNDVTAHAEIQAISAAAEFLGAKYLVDCTLYVTLEPCVMCAGALYWSQIGKVVFGAADEKRGAGRFEGLYHPKTEIQSGLMEKESSQLVRAFFETRRKE